MAVPGKLSKSIPYSTRKTIRSGARVSIFIFHFIKLLFCSFQAGVALLFYLHSNGSH